MTTNVERVGVRWLREEEDKLLDELANGMSTTAIASIHKRHVGGIICRIRKIAYDMHRRGNDIQTIIKATKLTEQEVKEAIEIETNKNKDTNTNANASIKVIADQLIEINKTLKDMLEMMRSNININTNTNTTSTNVDTSDDGWSSV